MRVALLSQQKYSALLNNFCQTQDVIVDLITNGADDITKNAREKELPEGALEKKEVDTEPTLRATQQAIDEMKADMRAGEPTDLGLEPRSTLPGNVVGATGLYDFMPTKRVISEKEELIHQVNWTQCVQKRFSSHRLDFHTDSCFFFVFFFQK